jgi:hypothetical protein
VQQLFVRPRDPVCSIDRTPVQLNTAKTDEDGNAVHEDCYVTKLGVAKVVGSFSKLSTEHLLQPRQRN